MRLNSLHVKTGFQIISLTIANAGLLKIRHARNCNAYRSRENQNYVPYLITELY